MAYTLGDAHAHTNKKKRQQQQQPKKIVYKKEKKVTHWPRELKNCITGTVNQKWQKKGQSQWRQQQQ